MLYMRSSCNKTRFNLTLISVFFVVVFFCSRAKRWYVSVFKSLYLVRFGSSLYVVVVAVVVVVVVVVAAAAAVVVAAVYF
ncbi:hypothetical protein ElyMa_004429700 [Elysia marginata]|uniref:Uncharacterized protein n=1 Tax=Elysia marginata TaxID=1093978 RepID=A0AAV4HD18_9GAST|nr:hypothetical protein ElyMa_004429700 [Elysia marginata]